MSEPKTACSALVNYVHKVTGGADMIPKRAYKWAGKALEELFYMIAIKLHAEACEECRKHYYAIKKHIEELDKDAEKVPVSS